MRRGLKKHGANLAGFFWNSGTALQFIFGLIASSPREISSAVCNIISSCSFMGFGHKNWGVALGGVIGTLGTLLAVWPGIINNELGTIFGFVVFVLFEPFAIFSAPLTQRYEHAKNAFVRETLGHPRRLNGLVFLFFARLPIIYECLMNDRWQLAICFAVWSMGDLAFATSKANVKR